MRHYLDGMRLSFESDRSRWALLAGTWLAVAFLLVVHMLQARLYLENVGKLGLRGQSTTSTPLSAAYPAFAADAQTWVRHALALSEGDAVRLRRTSIDNGLDGREVHWNSAWAWCILGAGRLESLVTGRPLPESIERSTLWLPGLALFSAVVAISWLASRVFGGAVAVMIAFGMVGHPRVFEGFYPRYVDHHGLLTVSVFGLVLGAVMMGAGWFGANQPGAAAMLPPDLRFAKFGARVSAVFGALGMWVSAASAIPPIAVVGLSGLLVAVLRGKATQLAGGHYSLEIWRTWGTTGAAASCFFYVLEYFPNHLALRLEANHPFYSIAWWGAGRLVGEIGNCGFRTKGLRCMEWNRMALPLGMIAIAPLVIVLGGERVFLPLNPFMSNLHKSIQEFLPLWQSFAAAGWTSFLWVGVVESIPLWTGLVLLVFWGRRLPILLWFGVLASALFAAMAWIQSRWLLNASGAQLVLLLLLVGWLVWGRSARLVWSVVTAVVVVAFVAPASVRYWAIKSEVVGTRVAPKDAQMALARDIAATIRASAPNSPVVLLSSPNSSTSIGYYGRFHTFGTLYWENLGGLRAAAEIFSALPDTDAAALARKYKVTHVAMVSEENFIEQYFRLINPSGTAEDLKRSLGYRLLVDRAVPTWLQMIPYKVPDDLAPLKTTVMLFKVAFDQSPADAIYHIALAKIAAGDTREAEADFDLLTEKSPDSHQPWLRKGELRFAAKDWDGALRALAAGIARAPPAERGTLYANAAAGFYGQKKYGHTIELYQSALRGGFDPVLGSYLAFVLATAEDDALRNGSESIRLAQAAVRSQPDSIIAWSALAAGYAESGDFEQAVAAGEKAVGLAREQKDAASERVGAERLLVYRRRQPVRN